MKSIVKILERFLKGENRTLLGRWNLDYCVKKVDTKIDLSNEDHCGPCGQYAISKIVKEKKEKITDLE